MDEIYVRVEQMLNDKVRGKNEEVEREELISCEEGVEEL